jgi:hypothetical protein
MDGSSLMGGGVVVPGGGGGRAQGPWSSWEVMCLPSVGFLLVSAFSATTSSVLALVF